MRIIWLGFTCISWQVIGVFKWYHPKSVTATQIHSLFSFLKPWNSELFHIFDFVHEFLFLASYSLWLMTLYYSTATRIMVNSLLFILIISLYWYEVAIWSEANICQFRNYVWLTEIKLFYDKHLVFIRGFFWITCIQFIKYTILICIVRFFEKK